MARVAMIVGEMFEEDEQRVPYDRLRAAGHEVVLVGLKAGQPLRGAHGRAEVTPELAVADVSAADFDALVIPGGYSPDHLRTDMRMVGFVRDFDKAGKPIGAICHAGSLLVEADIADGHTVTSWPSVRTDLINAGARWVDREVVQDGHLITSRKPADLEAFTQALIRQLAAAHPPAQPSA